MWRQPDPRRRSGTIEGDMTALPLVFDAPRAALPPRHLADLDPAERRAAVVAARAARLPGRPADPALLRPAGDRPGGDDRPAGAARSRAGRRAAARAADRGAAPGDRRGQHPQDAVAAARRRAGRERADALPRRTGGAITVCVSSQAGCGMACPFCATGQGGLTRNLSTRRDRRAGAVGRAHHGPRRAARRPGPAVERGVHGHGRAAGQLPAGGRRAAPAGRSRAGRPRALAALGHRLDGRAGARRSASSADEGLDVTLAVSLHAPDDELRDTLVPVNTRWKVGEVLARGRRLRRAHRAPVLDRVRDDPRRQRPAVAGRPARRAAARPRPRATST